jgi:hypothetical protein
MESTLTLSGHEGDYTINCVDKLTICGRTFSCNPSIEYESNVTNKIKNCENALKSWSKRALSIFGRNIILKTFGLSQLIYSMQNFSFDNSALNSIESICYSFLWNKKSNKSRAFERISRVKLKQDLASGGINAPDLHTFNEALKVKKLIRSTSKDNLHFINLLQTSLLEYDPYIIFQRRNYKCSNAFVNNAVIGMTKLGCAMINEILDSSDDSRLNRDYYDLIASENVINLVKRITDNRIIWLSLDNVVRKLGITYVGQLINEFKFPSNDSLKSDINNNINQLKLHKNINKLQINR